jgi:PPOX class probable F420-dependent enzyme
MANINDPNVQELLTQPNHGVISTLNADGSVHSTVVWLDAEDGTVVVNSAVGRAWPTNIERDPRVSICVYEQSNPYHFVEIRGRASGTTDGAEEVIDGLAKKYLGLDRYPYHVPTEQRITYVITPERVRHVKQ